MRLNGLGKGLVSWVDGWRCLRISDPETPLAKVLHVVEHLRCHKEGLFRVSQTGLAATEKMDALPLPTPAPPPKQKDLLSEFKKGF